MLKHQLDELMRCRGTDLRIRFIDQATGFIEEKSGQLELSLGESLEENASP